MRSSINEHVPHVVWANRHIVVTVVGCGGTGAQVAMGLPYLHQALLAAGHPYGLRVFLVDGDKITETNCVRQPFARSEIGLYKTVARTRIDTTREDDVTHSSYSAYSSLKTRWSESLRTEFAGTDIHVSVVLPVSTETEFRQAMARDYGHTVRGLGPKQTAGHVARAVVDCIRTPRAEVYPHRKSRGLTIVNALAPGFTDRLVRKYGRRREQ